MTFYVLPSPDPAAPPWSAVQSQPELRRCPAQILATQPTSISMNEGDNESIPSYENEGEAGDDGTGYIEVLPDPPSTDQGNGDCASSGSIAEPYENMPETESLQQSLESLVSEETLQVWAGLSRSSFASCLGAMSRAQWAPSINVIGYLLAAHTSDLESEDDTPDYENVCTGV
ncbi:hypothetical protein lerEdw1_006992 [Lerista edwardsae]|nr:hypothetical protein lerEdw1_006992 [Lerista edwardsae]